MIKATSGNPENLRFGFGENWGRFISVLNEAQIKEAEQSIKSILSVDSLSGTTFLDVGSGSGLFSLAAMRLGADKVRSIDYDVQSVLCARKLKQEFFPNAHHWTIEEGDALDSKYLSSIGQWDIVYSWGVLHHTGDLWKALDNIAPLVQRGGRLVVSIYNDQGVRSAAWREIKKFYNQGSLQRFLTMSLCVPFFMCGGFIRDVLSLRNPLKRYIAHDRGMSAWHDWIDWIGGYPFEVARPNDVVAFFKARHFVVERMNTCGRRLGCNEFIFSKQ